MVTRLGVVATHPIQHDALWSKHMAGATDLDLKVYYLWGNR